MDTDERGLKRKRFNMYTSHLDPEWRRQIKLDFAKGFKFGLRERKRGIRKPNLSRAEQEEMFPEVEIWEGFYNGYLDGLKNDRWRLDGGKQK